ncbi:DUF4391 domain-containing protein [Acidovorax sp.]|uniref:DUF4391 domain-containing protein n=1 Tax=Acidovorax sp. TaxID=1872122 RepID=UPI0025C2E5B9|nr:DUF4391 domain-containing protein [Acidovorax sp.]
MNVVDLTSEQLISALRLPAEASVGQRIPKKMLTDTLTSRGAFTSADRKLLQEQIEEVTWVAALKPSNAGVPAHQDETRSYLELAVLHVHLRQGSQLDAQAAKVSSNTARLAELLHRAIPYPVLMLLDDGARLYLSMAHIRWAQKEAEKTVLDGELIQGIFARHGSPIAPTTDGATLAAFLDAMDLSKQPRSDLLALYQSWMDTLSAWQAAAVTGRFECVSPQQAAVRRSALRRCHELDARISSLRAAASKEKQMARQVSVNLEINALMAERQQAANSL